MSSAGWNLLILVGGVAGVAVVLMVMVIVTVFWGYWTAPYVTGEYSMKTDDAPEFLYVVFENGCLIGAFEELEAAYRQRAARAAQSDRHGKGWRHVIGRYRLSAVSRFERDDDGGGPA